MIPGRITVQFLIIGSFFLEEKIMMDIKPEDLVLEVGSGDNPYPRSDVLLDKLPEDVSEREAGRSLVIDRPFVIGDVEMLPFANKSFDYIIASHVLEHTQDPERFLTELSRVGKMGYIETPLPTRERVFDFQFHRWYVYQEDKTLVLVKKTTKSKKFFAGMTADRRREFYHLEGEQLLNLKFEWEGKINFKIVKIEPDEFLKDLDVSLTFFLEKRKSNSKYWYQKIKSKIFLIPLLPLAGLVIKNFIFKSRKMLVSLIAPRERREIDPLSLLVCPICKGQLESKGAQLCCLDCEQNYPLFKNKIPQLLV